MSLSAKVALAGTAFAVLAACPASATTCADLVTSPPAHTTIDAAEEMAGGPFALPATGAVVDRPAFCRVHGLIAPVPGSRIGLELWMPLQKWNGKVEMFGNGGYSSGISYDLMAAALGAGYATFSTDTGHIGEDPDFALGHPERIADWGFRAVHESAMAAKPIVQNFYGAAAKHAYFRGCSTGGHQALMEAQRFPDDFDGIIAGDPGNNRTHLNAGFLWQYVANHPHGKDDAPILPASKLGMISRAVVAACHTLNGSRDGGLASDDFLDDPRDCHFDAVSLQCQGADAPDCLTPPQVSALKAMYAGAHDAKTGELIYFGWPPGSEGSSVVVPRLPGWSLYWADPAHPAQPARLSFWRDWKFGPDWNWWQFDWSGEMRALDATLAPVINANSPDLEAFRKSGGRLIQYHGLADPVVPFLDSITYFGRVVDFERQHAAPDVAGFYRLFLVPGMAHCVGGPGPDRFDVQAALENWVEHDAAPDRIVASKISGTGDARRITLSRPLCPYPQIARATGQGDPADAGGFSCIADPNTHEAPVPGPDYLQ
jgi:feruloyl esterase